MTLIYNFTLEDWLAFNRFHMRHSPSYRRTRFFVRVLFIPFAAIPVVLMFSQGKDVLGFALTLAVIAVIWFFAYPPMFDRRVEASIKRMLNEGNNRGMLGEHTVTILSEGIRSASPGGESFYKWNTVERVEETDEHIFVYVSSVQAVVIPKRSLQDASTDAVLAEINRFAPKGAQPEAVR